ncbi:MAG: hypothetical protein AAF990_03330 [Bacteroidota bacterium]
MIKMFNAIVWGLLIVGVLGIIFNQVTQKSVLLQGYVLLVEVYLLVVSAFFVLKRIAFYRLNGHVDTIRLIKKSENQVSLLGHGILLGLILLVVNRYQDTNLLSFNTLMIGLVITYYMTQVLLNGNPSIYINERSFTYDDYFIDAWDWTNIKRIEMNKDKLRLISNEKDFELDFNLIDEIDYHHVREEVERSILDGEFTKERSSKDLASIISRHANRNGLQLSQIT